jgi:hypothetical protein
MATVIAWADLQARLETAAISIGGVVLPISWPNRTFRAPAGTPAPWLLVEMTGGSGRPLELGGGIWLDEGQSFVHVLVPTNSGVADAMSIVDQVIAMFRSPPLEPVVYTHITADPGGPGSDDGLYWRTSVSADWRLQTLVPRS